MRLADGLAERRDEAPGLLRATLARARPPKPTPLRPLITLYARTAARAVPEYARPLLGVLSRTVHLGSAS
jgi:hypothetical protein